MSRTPPNVVIIDGEPFRFRFAANAVDNRFVKAVNTTFVTYQILRVIPDDERADDDDYRRRKCLPRNGD